MHKARHKARDQVPVPVRYKALHVVQVRQKARLEARRSEPRCKRPGNLSLSLRVSLSLFGRFLDFACE